jgi:aspartate aminotransferase, chloroplastic
MYSNPPIHGARIVAEVVNDETMFSEWKEEMEMMSGRIKGVRKLLFDELTAIHPERDWTFVLNQIGMFSVCS